MNNYLFLLDQGVNREGIFVQVNKINISSEAVMFMLCVFQLLFKSEFYSK